MLSKVFLEISILEIFFCLKVSINIFRTHNDHHLLTHLSATEVNLNVIPVNRFFSINQFLAELFSVYIDGGVNNFMILLRFEVFIFYIIL